MDAGGSSAGARKDKNGGRRGDEGEMSDGGGDGGGMYMDTDSGGDDDFGDASDWRERARRARLEQRAREARRRRTDSL